MNSTIDPRTKDIITEAAWDTQEAMPEAKPQDVVAALRGAWELSGGFTPQEIAEAERVALAAILRETDITQTTEISLYARLQIRNALVDELGQRVYARLWLENWVRDHDTL